MKYKYELPDILKIKAAGFKEFANGAAQASVLLKNNLKFGGLLVSDGRYLVAMRNQTDLPFGLQDIADIYQHPEDANPENRTGWDFWDDWT
jgi:hypothetical protein